MDIQFEGFFFLSLLCGFFLRFRLVTLEGIQDELIVGGPILRLIEPCLHALDISLGDYKFVRQQLPDIHTDRQALQQQHLPMLLVFYLQPLQVDILREDVHAHVINAHLRLQLLFQLFLRIVFEFVLYGMGIQQQGYNHQ